MISSNIILLFISFFSAFITPFILGQTQYGYYKIFTLYISYSPLLHFGFVDGFFIDNAGKDTSNISFPTIRSYTKFFVAFEFIVFIIIVLFSFLFKLDLFGKNILISFGVYSSLTNILTYFQFFMKSIMKFDEISFLTRLQSYSTFLYLLIAIFVYKWGILHINVLYYIVCVNLTQMIMILWIVRKYKYIVFGNSFPIRKQSKQLISFFKKGFSIMIAYQITVFIINSDNESISIFFNVNEYAKYAFSYSLALLVVTIFNAISLTIFPYMKKIGKEKFFKNNNKYLSIMSILTFFLMLSYYPIVIFVHNFMPSYVLALEYLKMIYPGVGIACIVQTYIFNSYMLINKMNVFCFISVGNLFVQYSCYFVINILFHDAFFIALFSIPLLILWYFSLEIYIHIQFNTKIFNNILYIIVMSVIFLICTNFFSVFFGMVYYILFFILITLILKNEFISKLQYKYFKKE